MVKTLRDFCSPKIGGALLALIAFGGITARTASASVISGPTLGTNDSGWAVSGIGFTATVDSMLTSFTIQNQGNSDTVDLVDSVGNILDSVAIPAATPSDTVSVNWSLTADMQYYLLQTTNSNSRYTSWDSAPPSDTEIALTSTGDFSNSGLDGANFGINGTSYWAAFNNITSSASSSTPEPASFMLVLPFLGALFWQVRRKGFLKLVLNCVNTSPY